MPIFSTLKATISTYSIKIIVILVGIVVALSFTLKHYVDELAETKVLYELSKGEISSLNKIIKEQNNAIKDIKITQEDKEELIKTVIEIENSYEDKQEEILNTVDVNTTESEQLEILTNILKDFANDK